MTLDAAWRPSGACECAESGKRALTRQRLAQTRGGSAAQGHRLRHAVEGDTRAGPRGRLDLAQAVAVDDQRAAEPQEGRRGQQALEMAVRIRIADDELARLDGLKLVAGMPVEAFIQTTPRTVVSYLVKLLGDQIARAFKGR